MNGGRWWCRAWCLEWMGMGIEPRKARKGTERGRTGKRKHFVRRLRRGSQMKRKMKKGKGKGKNLSTDFADGHRLKRKNFWQEGTEALRR